MCINSRLAYNRKHGFIFVINSTVLKKIISPIFNISLGII